MQACGVGTDLIDGVLRLSFCASTTVGEAERAAAILNETVQKDKDLTK